MPTTSNFGWNTPADTDLVKDGALAIRTLGNNIDTSLVDLKGGTTGQVLSKASNSDLDYTWVTTDDANAIQNAIVDAKGDLIAASANDTPARLAVGNNGETLVADSSASTGLRWQGNYSAGKNFVINGNMNIAQRGTSLASLSTGETYLVDRFALRNNNLGTATYSQEADAPTGFKTSSKILFTTADATPAAGDFAYFRTKFEGQALQLLKKGTASAVTTTLSFWVKSNVTGTYVVQLYDADNVRYIGSTYTISTADTWEKKSLTFAGDTSGALDNDSGVSIQIGFGLGAGTDRTSGTLQTSWGAAVTANELVGQVNVAATVNNYWQITGVQWEIGNVATDFQLSSGTLAGELAACQRYYQRITGTGATNMRFGTGFVDTTTGMELTIPFPVQMRTRPTALETTGTAADYIIRHAAGTNTTCSGIPIYIQANEFAITVAAGAAAGLTAGQAAALRVAAATAYLGWSAEL